MIEFVNVPGFEGMHEPVLAPWLRKVAGNHGRRIARLTYNFVSPEEILRINREHLQHDYVTDIISFDYSSGQKIEGEIYICTQQIKEQAPDFLSSPEQECLRVIAHGLLHLIGFDDHKEEDIRQMRKEEEKALLLHAKILRNKEL